MKKDVIRERVIQDNSPSVLLEMSTGAGKTRIALEIVKSVFPISVKKSLPENFRILIVVPKLVLITTWKKEIAKWKYSEYLPYVEFVTYISFPKKAGHYNVVIYDEVHHLTPRCINNLSNITSDKNILLSATVGYKKKDELYRVFNRKLLVYQLKLREAIEENLLPDPQIILCRLVLNRKDITHCIVKNPKANTVPLKVSYANRFSVSHIKNKRILIPCTQGQYYDDLTHFIAWLKAKQKWDFHRTKCLERLKWLCNQKTDIVSNILSRITQHRSITFCSGIEQSELLGTNCVHSKNKEGKIVLDKFNNKEINHITCVAQLDEGVNLADCKIGIFAMLNSSDRLTKQRIGRILRHKKPVIIIPYFMNTREEEIVNEMRQHYNPELISTVTNIGELIDKLNTL